MDHYADVAFLNAGIGGMVYAATIRSTGERVALKTIKKSAKTSASIAREVTCALSLSHPGIIKTIEVVFEDTEVHVVQEYADGGDLFDSLRDHGCMSDESSLKVLFSQIASAVKYMHGEGFCHRDLKPENIVLMSRQPTSEIVAKLIDFGMAEKSRSVQNRAGTDAYGAPEIVAVENGASCDGFAADIWSLGIILVALLSGRIPWTLASPEEDINYSTFLQRHAKGHGAAVFNAPSEALGMTSVLANLLNAMLNPDPASRPGIVEVVNSIALPWFQSKPLPCDEFSSNRTISMSDSGCSWGDFAPDDEVDFSSLPIPDFESQGDTKTAVVKADSGVSVH